MAFEKGTNMKYVFYNIRNLAKNEKFVFAVMLLCIFISAWIMTFSYGLYQHYFSMRTEADMESKQINPEIAEGQTLTRGEAKAYLDSLSDELTDDLNVIACRVSYSFKDATRPDMDIGQPIFSRFVIRNGTYRISSYISDIWNESNMIVTGRFLSDSEEMNGTPSALVEQITLTNDVERAQLADILFDDDTMLIYGQRFKIVGTHTSGGIVAPFLSIPEEIPLNFLTFSFENTVTRKNYNELVKRADEIIPGKLIFPEFSAPDEESIYIYNNIMMISVLIAVLVIINFAFLYSFIFGKRRRQLAVMRICGCTAAQAWAICLGECIAICVPVFLVGMLTYIPFMHGVLSDVFVYMEDSYKPWIYAAIFGIYIAALVVIMGIFLAGQIGKTLAEGRKETA